MEDVFSFNGTEYSVEDLNSEGKLILEYIFEINSELKSLKVLFFKLLQKHTAQS